MNNLIKNTFNLIKAIRYIKKQKLLIDLNDENIMAEYYKRLGVIGISYFTYRKKIIKYSIDHLTNIKTSCKEVEKILLNNGR